MRRFALVSLAFGAGLVLLASYAKGNRAVREAGAEPQAPRVAAAEAAQPPATQPAVQAEQAVQAAQAAKTPAPTATPQAQVEAPAAPAVPPAPPAPPAPTITSAPAAAVKSVAWKQLCGQPGRKLLLGSRDPDAPYVFQVELITDGAAINTVKLNGYYATVADKRLAEADYEAYNEALDEDGTGLGGPYSLMNRVDNAGSRHLPLATREVSVTFPDGRKLKWSLDNVAWKFEGDTVGSSAVVKGDSAAFSCPLSGGAKTGMVLKLTKTYTIREGDYTIDVSLRAENLTSQPLEISVDQAGPTGLPREGHRDDMRKVAFGKYVNEEGRVHVDKQNKRKAKPEDVASSQHIVGKSGDSDPVLWIGQTNKFFGAMMYLVPRQAKKLSAPAWRAEFYTADVLENALSPTQITGVVIPQWKLPPHGQGAVLNFELFAGPKRREMFDDEGAEYFKPRYKQLDYISTVDLRSCWCASDWLSMMMIRFLQMLSVVSFGNYGVAIILLVLLVRLLLHPLTKKSQVSMSKMKKLAPMMKELEKKYPNDKEALTRERLKLTKQQGAAPLLGCLPMMLQMPILISLYTGINASIDLRHAAFLPVWITDLAAPDMLFTWSTPLPLIGTTAFNLLPILLGVAMYWQMKLSPQTQATTPEQEKQQKMMAMMMPAMMPVLFYSMASGLTLYFMASTFIGAAESHIIRKHIEVKEAAEAAAETTVRLPGKGPRDSRPKKSKGPMWFKKG